MAGRAMTRVTANMLRRQIVDIEVDIGCMRADYVRIGERSDWQDVSLDARYEDIRFWEDRVGKVRRELRRLEAREAALADEANERDTGHTDPPRPAA